MKKLILLILAFLFIKTKIGAIVLATIPTAFIHGQVSPESITVTGIGDTHLYQGFVPVFQTTDSSQSIYFSVDIPENTNGSLEVIVEATTNDYTNSAGGTVKVFFKRDTTDVVLQGIPLIALSSGFTGIKPSITMTANASTEQIDIKVRGIPSDTLNWTSHYNLRTHP